MFLTGVGGSQDAMKQIKEGGLYRATFLYNPNMAASAVNMARLVALGATVAREEASYTVLRDPEGNAFCVVEAKP